MRPTFFGGRPMHLSSKASPNGNCRNRPAAPENAANFFPVEHEGGVREWLLNSSRTTFRECRHLPPRESQHSHVSGGPSLSAERSAEPTRRQPRHPSEILRQTALAREPGPTRNLDNRAVFIAQEFQRTPDAPFREKSVR